MLFEYFLMAVSFEKISFEKIVRISFEKIYSTLALAILVEWSTEQVQCSSVHMYEYVDSSYY